MPPGSSSTTSFKAWRDADCVDGKPYGMPYDGEVTVQVYRKDLYDAKGLKPADDLRPVRRQRRGAERRRTIASGARRCAASPAPARTCTSTRRSSASSAANWFKGGKLRRQRSRSRDKRSPGTSTLMRKYAPPAVRNWNWPDIADAFSQGTVGTLHRRALVGGGDQQSREVEGDRQDRLRALAEGPDRQARDARSGTGASRSTPRWPKRRRRRRGCSSSGRRQRGNAGAHVVQVSPGPTKRSGVNRTSIWKDAGIRQADERRWRQLRRGDAGIAASRTPTSTGVRACRNGRRSATRWRPPSSRRSRVRPPQRRRSTRRSAASSR